VAEEFKAFVGDVAGRQEALHRSALPRVPVLFARHLHLASGIPVVTALLVHAAVSGHRRGIVQFDDPEQVLERPGRPGPDVRALLPLLLLLLLSQMLLLLLLLIMMI